METVEEKFDMMKGEITQKPDENFAEALAEKPEGKPGEQVVTDSDRLMRMESNLGHVVDLMAAEKPMQAPSGGKARLVLYGGFVLIAFVLGTWYGMQLVEEQIVLVPVDYVNGSLELGELTFSDTVADKSGHPSSASLTDVSLYPPNVIF